MSFEPASFGANALGLDRAVIVSKKLEDAFKDPADYYKKRNAALIKVQAEANEVFTKKFQKLQLAGWSEDECKVRAKAFTQAVMAASIAEFEAENPESITSISASLVARKSVSGQSIVNVSGQSVSRRRTARKSRK